MRFFIKRVVSFLSISLTIVLTIFILVKFKLTKQNPFQFDVGVNKLILGHSHIETSLNDKLLTNTVSIAHSADGFFYSYVKLKEAVRYNKIDTLILSFTPSDLINNDERWTFHPSHMESRLGRFIYFLDADDRRNLEKKSNVWQLPILLKGVPLTFVGLLRSRDKVSIRSSFGGYDPDENTLDISKEIRPGTLPKEQTINNISDFDQEYLEKIIYLCEKESIDIIF